MKDKSIDGLLPCPFCGGEALLENTITEATIWCCDCPATVRRLHTTRTFDDGTHRAIAAWNTRSNNAPALVEALQEAKLQLEYMDERSPSGTTPTVLARIHAVLSTALGEMNDG